MCGICGFSGPSNEPLLKGMAASLAHRGPDEDGFFSDGGNISLGMRRLKIIDFATGSQPISNEDNTVTVVFNGEIYNFKELRADLQAKGHRFRTNTDTEVLVHLYEEHGEAFPKLLRGMFAFALWDAKARKLMLARDQFGIKPLYYALSGNRLYFASELKALRLAAGVCGDLDPLAVDYYFTYLYVPAPLTIYKGVKKLEPASTLVFSGGAVRTAKYWELQAVPGEERTEEYCLEGIKDLLSKSVKEQLVSDVPLGLLLSGGMDSVSILAFMAEHAGAGVKAFTAGFGEESFDELPAARAAARHFGAEHIEIPVRADIGAVIRELAGQFDEPFADSSALANYLVTKEARKHVTVALAGVGGGRTFCRLPAPPWRPPAARLPESPGGPERVRRPGRVKLLGFRQDVGELLADSEIFVAPAVKTMSDQGVIEAMRAGLAIISADAGGNPEALNWGQAGKLVPAGDAVALASALSSLAGSPRDLISLAARAREFYTKTHSLPALAAGAARIYHSVLK
ncbi:MAG: asparagine synthase (glutamine-hydrolyzing) [Elusimicrobia bacterium]|nr:asparagine synthase (glutamine-hydrolyzing) [Elusimicrobiota bacterium]